jgi:hypothetical protein
MQFWDICKQVEEEEEEEESWYIIHLDKYYPL